MTTPLSWYVPPAAYAAQLAIAIVGLGFLAAVRAEGRAWLLAGTAYPVGAAVVGLVQWAAFASGIGWVAMPVNSALLATALPLALLRLRPPTARLPWLTVGVVSALLVVGFLISQSGPLAGDDPRYQIGYRAKIIAGYDGFAGGPYWTDAAVLHTNPKYPLLLSSTQAVTRRAIGQSEGGSECRAVTFAYFASFTVLLCGYAANAGGATRGAVALAACLCVPRIWTTGLEEGYADLPLGVYLMAAILWSVEEYGWPVLTVCGLGLAGLKSEGVMAAAVFSLAVGVIRPGRRAGLIKMASLLGGAAVAVTLFKIGVAQTAPEMPMENVQLGEVTSDALKVGADRWPGVVARFFEMLTDHKSFGFFFPVAIVLSLLGSRSSRVTLAASTIYLMLLTVPFLVTRLPLDFHLNSTIPRFGFQVLPPLCVALTTGVGQLQSTAQSTAITPGRRADLTWGGRRR